MPERATKKAHKSILSLPETKRASLYPFTFLTRIKRFSARIKRYSSS